jgi:hypothetical protein
MIPAHVSGLPIEEALRALALAGTSVVYVAVGLFAWLRRR